MTSEYVQKGKNGYNKGVVTYTNSKGENKQQTLFSFANPAVFATLKAAVPGQDYMVDTTKNDAGYDQWSAVKPVSEADAAPVQGGTKAVTKSTYETAEERAARQVLIVRQSSLSAAVGTLSPGAKSALDSEQVLALAQKYTDWVFQSGVEELGDIPL
jgi:hypothetical protein